MFSPAHCAISLHRALCFHPYKCHCVFMLLHCFIYSCLHTMPTTNACLGEMWKKTLRFLSQKAYYFAGPVKTGENSFSIHHLCLSMHISFTEKSKGIERRKKGHRAPACQLTRMCWALKCFKYSTWPCPNILIVQHHSCLFRIKLAYRVITATLSPFSSLICCSHCPPFHCGPW